MKFTFVEKDGGEPMFKNLRNLSLGLWCINNMFSPLRRFVRHSPMLRMVTLRISPVSAIHCIASSPCFLCPASFSFFFGYHHCWKPRALMMLQTFQLQLDWKSHLTKEHQEMLISIRDRRDLILYIDWYWRLRASAVLQWWIKLLPS